MTTRASDRGRIAAWWGRWGRDLTTVVAVALSAWAVFGTQKNVNDLRAESAQRRAESAQRIDETCRISETKQRSDVEGLRRTYEYLAGLTPKQFGEPLNRAVLAGLPTTIREAETDDAPAYCDAPGVGLPEPDPKLPRRPKGIPRG